MLKEEFQFFWSYSSIAWAKKFFRSWCDKAMRSRLEPIKEIVKTLRKHEPLIMNWFEAKDAISLGAVEGQNNKLKSSIRKSYGFKKASVLKIALYHRLGDLPTPEFTHKYF
ncbi:MAG: transposase [Oligoflexia bacterium]|nr:transposase [Oligoflexia bacterium]